MKVCSLYSSSKQKLYNKVLGKFTGSDAPTMKVKKAKDTFSRWLLPVQKTTKRSIGLVDQ
jgi:hypothetical protein